MRWPKGHQSSALARRWSLGGRWGHHDPGVTWPRRACSRKGELAAYWAFSVDDDPRVVLRWDGEEAFLVNLGYHDEVY